MGHFPAMWLSENKGVHVLVHTLERRNVKFSQLINRKYIETSSEKLPTHHLPFENERLDCIVSTFQTP